MQDIAITTGPAPAWVATLTSAESGDFGGTATWEAQTQDIADRLGHLKETKADLAAPALTGNATAVNLAVSGTLGVAGATTLAATDINGVTTLDGATTVNGGMTHAASSPIRFASTTLTDASATIDPTYHTYFLPAPTATRDISLNIGTSGQRVRFVRSSTGAFQWRIKRTGSSNFVVLLDNESRSCADLEYGGSGWVLTMYSPDALPGVDAE